MLSNLDTTITYNKMQLLWSFSKFKINYSLHYLMKLFDKSELVEGKILFITKNVSIYCHIL